MAISSALLTQMLAVSALTQLNKRAVFARSGVVGYERGNFRFEERVKVRRPRRRRAQNLNPRLGAATFSEGEFFSGDISLDRLWVDGYPVFGSDPTGSLQLYIQETGSQLGDSILSPNEDYLYEKFRTYNATTGVQAIGAHAPVRFTTALDENGDIADFNAEGLRYASTVLDGFEVPPESRFALISTVAKGAFLGDSVLVDGFAASLNLNAGRLIQTGMPNGEFVPRYGFGVAGSTSVTGQDAQLMLADGSASAALTGAVADTDFTYADLPAGLDSIGATRLTLDAAATTLGPNIAIGQIMRLADAAVAHRYFGLILRIDQTTPTAPVITMVVCDSRGNVVDAAKLTEIIAATALTASVPSIGSVNVAYHQEALLIANRFIEEPSPGSGATATSVVDPQTNMTIQLFNGAYDLKTVSESRAGYMLTGAMLSDTRKTVAILSK